jgi:hypothetical protein
MTNKIFWLEDNPNFLPFMEKLCPPLDFQDLLSRTTFAPDFNTGRQIVTANTFDLYLLDGDFPTELTSERKAEVEEFLKKVRTSTARTTDLKFDDGKNYSTNDTWNNFIPFYQKCLSPDKKVVIYSSSLDAAVHALRLNLPFYPKSDRPDTVLKYIRSTAPLHMDVVSSRKLDQWEIGTTPELINEYLLK